MYRRKAWYVLHPHAWTQLWWKRVLYLHNSPWCTYSFLTSMLTSWLRSSQCSSEWGGSKVGSFCLCTQNSSAFSRTSEIWSDAAISGMWKRLCLKNVFLYIYIIYTVVRQTFTKGEEVQLLELIMSAPRLDYSKSMTLHLSLSLLANTDAVALMTLWAQ